MKMKFTKESRNAILCAILGNGVIDNEGRVILRYSVLKSDYAEWKRKWLMKRGVKCSEIEVSGNSVIFHIKPTKWAKLLKRIIYNHCRKTVGHPKLWSRLGKEHLAQIYLDKGSITNYKTRYTLSLNTNSSKEDNQVLIEYLNGRYGVSFYQMKWNGKYYLQCGTKEARKFLNLIRNKVEDVPSISHKLRNI